MVKETLMLDTLEATLVLGRQYGQKLPPNSVLLLTGELGSGKTAFAKGVGQGLGIVDPILSPTFTLLHEYTQGRLPFYHFDLYRLSPEQVADITPELYWEGIEVPPGITVIEWSERLMYKPPHYQELFFKVISDHQREVTIKSVDC